MIDKPVRAEYRPIDELLHEMWMFGRETLTHRISARLQKEFEELRTERDALQKDIDEDESYEEGYQVGKEYMQDEVDSLKHDVEILKEQLARWEA